MTQKEELQQAVTDGMEPLDGGEQTDPTSGPLEGPTEGPIQEEQTQPERGGIMGKLLNNEPNPPLQDVDLAPDKVNGGIPRIIRAVNKFVGGDISPDRPPALLDFILGLYEFSEQKGLMDEVKPGSDTDTANTPEPSDTETNQDGYTEVDPQNTPFKQ